MTAGTNHSKILLHGNCTISGETTDIAVAQANPIRYRGYYYDEDTGLYYCNARYYSPTWRRFISPDDTSYLDPESVNGLNQYCYCGNDPINYADPSGRLAISLILTAIGIGAAIGAGIGMATTVVKDLENGKLFDGDVTFWAYFGNVLGGGIAGAGIGLCSILGAGAGAALATNSSLMLGGMTISGGTAFMMGVGGAFVTGALGYAVRTGISDQETFEWSDMFIEAGINAFSGALTFTGAMAGGIMGVKIPGARFSAKNALLYNLGAAYFGVYPAKIMLSIIKGKLKDKY